MLYDKALKIMIVDDNKDFREALKFLIQSIFPGSMIITACSGIGFLEQVNDEPTIVFMDIHMPGMNGIEASKRALLKYSELTIIGISSFDSKFYKDEMLNAGAKSFVAKSDLSRFKVKDLISSRYA